MGQPEVTEQPAGRNNPVDVPPGGLQGWLVLPAGRSHVLSGAVLYRGGPLAAGLVVATGLLAAVLVPLHAWRPALVVPLLVLALVALVWLVRYLPAAAEPVWPVAAIAAVSAGHAGWAVATHAEHVVLRRDAGAYALYSQWISTHHGLPVDAMLSAFGGGQALGDPAFRLASPAFYAVVHGTPGTAGASADLVPQFFAGAPALFSLGWWAGGWEGLLITPALLSGLALFALGGLAARLFGARWAVLAVAVLAIAQPMLHVARSTYSEPAATILVAAAAALLADAVRSLSAPAAARSSAGQADAVIWPASRLALLSGLAFGLCGLVRVDSLREVSLVFPVAAVLALRPQSRSLAKPLVHGALGGTVVAVVPALLLSRPYVVALGPSLVPLIGAGVVLGLGSWAAVWWMRRRVQNLHDHGKDLPRDHASSERPERVVAGAVAVVGVLLASRPLWMTVRQSPRDRGSRVVAGLQQRQGLKVDGGRTYAEHSLNWINWYLGPICIVLAWIMFSGLAYAAVRWWRASSRPDPAGPQVSPTQQTQQTQQTQPIQQTTQASETPPVPIWLGPAVIAFGSLLLTLYRPGITPDHPWADRRMVPIVLPAFVLAATAMIAWIVRYLAGHVRRPRAAATASLVAGVAGALCLLVPAWLGTAPVATASTEKGELSAVHRVCAALHPGDAVLSIDYRAANEWPQVIRGACGYPAASIQALDPDGYAAAVPPIVARIKAAGRHPVLLAATVDGVNAIRELGLDPVLVADLSTSEDQHLLTRRPDGEDHLDVQVWLGAG